MVGLIVISSAPRKYEICSEKTVPARRNNTDKTIPASTAFMKDSLSVPSDSDFLIPKSIAPPIPVIMPIPCIIMKITIAKLSAARPVAPRALAIK